MATGASTADLAIILIDARKGVLPQTRRHTRIVAMMGIRHVLLAVNKMDLVDYGQQVFDAIVDEYAAFAAQCGVTAVRPIPISALEGDHLTGAEPAHAVVRRADRDELPRERRSVGPAVGRRVPDADPVVNRPGPDFRGACRTRLHRARCTPAIGCGCCRPALKPRSTPSSPWTGRAAAPRPATRSR